MKNPNNNISVFIKVLVIHIISNNIGLSYLFLGSGYGIHRLIIYLFIFLISLIVLSYAFKIEINKYLTTPTVLFFILYFIDGLHAIYGKWSFFFSWFDVIFSFPSGLCEEMSIVLYKNNNDVINILISAFVASLPTMVIFLCALFKRTHTRDKMGDCDCTGDGFLCSEMTDNPQGKE